MRLWRVEVVGMVLQGAQSPGCPLPVGSARAWALQVPSCFLPGHCPAPRKKLCAHLLGAMACAQLGPWWMLPEPPALTGFVSSKQLGKQRS